MAIAESVKLYKYCIVEFLEDEAAEVVPCSWIIIDNLAQQFNCKWPGSKVALKYIQSQKIPLLTWSTHACVPRKFFRKLKLYQIKNVLYSI